MRMIGTLALCFVLLAGSATLGVAAGKEVKLDGKLTCAKCDLKKEKECATVIVTKEGGKDVVYYLDDKSHKAHHSDYCSSAKDGSVTGTVSEKDGKKIITATKVEAKK